MRKKFIKSILIVFVLITQLSLLKAQTQEIDLSGQWGWIFDAVLWIFVICIACRRASFYQGLRMTIKLVINLLIVTLTV
jgi:hypothetical protein